MKIIIYGAGDYASLFLKRIISNKNIEIVCFCETVKTVECFNGYKVIDISELNEYKCDYIVVAIYEYEKAFDRICEEENYIKNKTKFIPWDNFIYMINYMHGCENKTDSICELPCGTKYIYNSKDKTIGKRMLLTQKNWAQDDIDYFFELTNKYYGHVDRKGYFLDIGANIGTTSIYANKVLNTNLKVIAFEPGEINYKYLTINKVLNGLECYDAYKLGIGDEKCTIKYSYCEDNSGGSCINPLGRENIEVTTLDSFVEEKNINVDMIDYIWIDTEGYEAKVVLGATKCLKQKKIPLFQEFNPGNYDVDIFENYYNILSCVYEGFVDVTEKKENKISNLKSYYKNNKEIGRQSDIFLF